MNKRVAFVTDNSILIELVGWNKRFGSVNYDCIPTRAEIEINKDTIEVSLYIVSISGDYFLHSKGIGAINTAPLSLSKAINDHLRDKENFLILIHK